MPAARTRQSLSWLRAAREAAGLSQTDLGKLAGQTQAQISHYETGADTPSQAIKQRIAEALDADVTRLFADSPSAADVIQKHLAPNGKRQPQKVYDEEVGEELWDVSSLGAVDSYIYLAGPKEGTVEHVDAHGNVVAVETEERLILVRAGGLPTAPTPRTAPRARARRTKGTRRKGNAPPDDPSDLDSPASGLSTAGAQA